jgi:hypothetical protein
MQFERLLEIVGDEPMFETGLLLAGDVDPAEVRQQLVQWTEAGQLHRLRHDLYALALPFRTAEPHPFLVANRMVRGSYVSFRSALAHYGLVPNHEPVVTSVTTGRSALWHTPLGSYEFRYIEPDLRHGYRVAELGGEQRAFVALPEKALLDLMYLVPEEDWSDCLQELGVRDLGRLDLGELLRQVDFTGNARLRRAAGFVIDLAHSGPLERKTPDEVHGLPR